MMCFPLALFGDIGGPELLVVFAAILLLFGGRRLPSIARQMGKMVEDLRKTSQDFRNQLLHADEDMEKFASGREQADTPPPAPALPAASHDPSAHPAATSAPEPSTAHQEPSTRDHASG